MNRFSVVLFAILLMMGTSGHSFATDRQLMTPPSRSIAPVSDTKTWSDWPACRKAATAGVASAIAKWQREAVLRDVVISGVTAAGGTVMGPDLQATIENTMAEAGVPAAVAKGFAAPVSNAWRRWASSLRVPGLNWYPAFVCYAGPVAPPTPNVPMPLAALGGNPEPLSAAGLKAAIREALGARAQEREALAAIDGFADDFAARFSKYLTSVKVTNVMGSGGVPTFAPPYGPKCGPVVDGRGTMTPGGFVGAWPGNR